MLRDRDVREGIGMLEAAMVERIASEAGVKPEQVGAAVQLLDKGATIPFVARYRKDVTGNLDEVQLERIAERNHYYTSLLQRRNSIVENVRKQGKLSPKLEEALRACLDKNELEDLYLPFKQKRRTKATAAREQGLEPLADFILQQEADERGLQAVAETFVSSEKGVADADAALEGAQFILAERVSLHAETRTLVRTRMLEDGRIHSVGTKLAENGKTKFETYYDFEEPLKSIPSHRFLALLRGVREGVLRMDILVDDEAVLNAIAAQFIRDPESEFAAPLREAIDDAYKRLLRPSIENEVLASVRKAADEHAIHVFRENAQNLLMAPPAGRMPVIGVDPGLRTGCKLAVIDDTGHFLEHATVFLQASDERVQEARTVLQEMLTKHGVKAVAIGNGTGSREAYAFVREVLREQGDRDAFAVLVNEAGASVYSASKIAREEFPDLDVTVRGAVSIARRLQDPLAELVKIDPKNIGVGQYQHDVNQKQLREGLERSVISCVNRVGVDLNTASVPLLRYVSGIQFGTAQNIVQFRTDNGGFRSREQLLEVDGMSVPPGDLIGKSEPLESIAWDALATEVLGRHALEDIKNELVRPGRDPRRKFRVPRFLEGVVHIKDLEVGMTRQGVVTNVTDFGAFIDIGVHHDGLVHLSEMASKFVHDPQRLVHVGQIVTVKVIAVDKEMPRISLSMKQVAAEKQAASGKRDRRRGRQEAQAKRAVGENPEGPRRDGRRSDRKRPANARHDRKPRRSGKGPDRQDRQSGGKPKTPATPDRMNTQLADQLEALKKSMGR